MVLSILSGLLMRIDLSQVIANSNPAGIARYEALSACKAWHIELSAGEIQSLPSAVWIKLYTS
jgi:hypothetical protein